jgi:hypothetical protein
MMFNVGAATAGTTVHGLEFLWTQMEKLTFPQTFILDTCQLLDLEFLTPFQKQPAYDVSQDALNT